MKLEEPDTTEPETPDPVSEVLFTGLRDLSLPNDQLDRVLPEPDDRQDTASMRVAGTAPCAPGTEYECEAGFVGLLGREKLVSIGAEAARE